MRSQNRPRMILHRVSVHGTSGKKGIPSIHTRSDHGALCCRRSRTTLQMLSGTGETTVFPCTGSPNLGARTHRRMMHTPTVFSYTGRARTTVCRYTETWAIIPVLHSVFRPNCTKPSCTKDNNRVGVLFEREALS